MKSSPSRAAIPPAQMSICGLWKLQGSSPKVFRLRAMLQDAGFSVEREIDEDLPLVMADPPRLSPASKICSVIAMKYANGTRWMAIRVRMEPADAHSEVQVSVED